MVFFLLSGFAKKSRRGSERDGLFTFIVSLLLYTCMYSFASFHVSLRHGAMFLSVSCDCARISSDKARTLPKRDVRFILLK